jgi:oligopeptide/dipeptide ABC transporter ATP-binding protein
LSALLEVTDLRTHFRTDDGIVKAVDGVTFRVERGKTLGIVGESGSGKSVTCLTVMGLNDAKKTTSTGSVVLDGAEILGASTNELQAIRGQRIAMIFQDPMTSLNPVKSIGWQLEEAVLVHQDVTKKVARDRAIELLKEVGIPRAEVRVDDYPHQFSGGMRQRVMIAMALINEPEILIADEPTTALDVTTQAQILKLMQRLQDEHGTAIIMITHDLGVVAEVAHDVVVMYAGKIIEEATVDDLFTAPQHPYTWGLLGSLPRLHSDTDRLYQIAGQPPSLLNPPSGCAFHPRCPYVFDRCPVDVPELVAASGNASHLHRCLLPDAQRSEHWHANPASKVVEAA